MAMLDLVLDALSAYRLTRLVTKDVVLDRPRAAIIRTAYVWRDGGIQTDDLDNHPIDWQEKAETDDEAPKLAELIVCRWCTGLYISLGIVAARRYAGVLWDPLARALTLSAAAALVARLEDG